MKRLEVAELLPALLLSALLIAGTHASPAGDTAPSQRGHAPTVQITVTTVR